MTNSEKVLAAINLVNEVIGEVMQRSDTDNNKRIAMAINTLGKDTFLDGLENLQKLVKGLDQ